MSFDTPLPPYLSTTDPQARYLSQTSFDLLLIELVPLCTRLSSSSSSSPSSPPYSLTTTTTTTLENLGYRVGQGLAERFSANKPRFTETLDVIKFLCKDVWTVCWRKQVDGLKTNHRGVYVLTDNTFRPLLRMSVDVRDVNVVKGGDVVNNNKGDEDNGDDGVSERTATARARPFLFFPCGIIRGVLSGLGIEATVNAETMELPTATFQIKTVSGGGGFGRG